MADHVTREVFEKFAKRMEVLFNDIHRAIHPRLIKAYPQMKNPEPGDELSRAALPNGLTVSVKTNMTTPTHWIEFRRENMATVPNCPRVQVSFVNGNPGSAIIALPMESVNPTDYVLVCYIGGDDPANPGTAQHHIDKIGVTVKA